MPPPPARSLMAADCHAREMDDLHCWWLPPEIFADIGIAAPPAAVGAEVVAARLAGLLGGASRGKEAAPPQPSPPLVAAPHQQREQVCGLEGVVLVPFGGVVAAPPPFSPNSPVQWQVPINHVNGGGTGALAPRYSPLRRPSPPPPNWVGGGGGTGVFLPRAEAYRTIRPPPATKSPAKGAHKGQLVNQQRRVEAAPGMKRPSQSQTAAAAAAAQLQQHNTAAAVACGSPELGLPKEWVY